MATGAIPEAAAHPVRRFYDAGVPIVLNTDDPALFRTTLSQEYELAARLFGFGDSEMAEIARNGFHTVSGAVPSSLAPQTVRVKRDSCFPRPH